MLATIVPLLLLAASAGAPAAALREEIETQVTAIYGPYADRETSVAAWDYPIYSAELTALIARWKAVMPQDETDALNDGDWLCQCQDWNNRRFLASIVAIGMDVDGRSEVDVIIDLGISRRDATRAARLILKREQAEWKVDEIIGDAFPDGLRQALHETIAADEALAAGKAG